MVPRLANSCSPQSALAASFDNSYRTSVASKDLLATLIRFESIKRETREQPTPKLPPPHSSSSHRRFVILPQHRQELRKVLRDRAGEIHALATARMIEAQRTGMQRLAREIPQHLD